MNDTPSTPTPRGPSAASHGLVAGSALAAIALIVGVWVMQGGTLAPMTASPAQTGQAGQVTTYAPATAQAWQAPVAAPGQPPQARIAAVHPTPWADPRLFQQWAAMAGTYGYPPNYALAAQAMLMNAMRAWHAQLPVAAAHAPPVTPRG